MASPLVSPSVDPSEHVFRILPASPSGRPFLVSASVRPSPNGFQNVSSSACPSALPSATASVCPSTVAVWLVFSFDPLIVPSVRWYLSGGTDTDRHSATCTLSVVPAVRPVSRPSTAALCVWGFHRSVDIFELASPSLDRYRPTRCYPCLSVGRSVRPRIRPVGPSVHRSLPCG